MFLTYSSTTPRRDSVPSSMNDKVGPNSEQDAVLPEGYVPQPHDILCGKSKESFNHVGNRRFRVTISVFLQKYTDLKSRSERGALIASVVDMIHSNGGHFLKERNNRWVMLTSKQARSKVGHALRDASFQQQRASTTRLRDDEDDDDDDDAALRKASKRQRTLPEPVQQQLSWELQPLEVSEVAGKSKETGDEFQNWSVGHLDFLLDDLSSDSDSMDDDQGQLGSPPVKKKSI